MCDDLLIFLLNKEHISNTCSYASIKVFYYSSFIFKDAGIVDEYIQYAILSTGVVNVITTIVCVFLIDKLGRKPLLIFPMAVILLDFVGLILSMQFKVKLINV